MIRPIALGVVALLSSATIAHAEYSEELTALTLAQQCVAEIDFSNPDECWLMWHVNQELAEKRAEREPDWHLVDQLRAYNSGFKVKTPRTTWVMELNLEGRKPEHWPEGVDWGRYALRWMHIVERAWEFMDDPGRHPCPSVNGYGGECYRNPNGACDRAPWCWIQVVCHKSGQKPFAQAYYQTKRCSERTSAGKLGALN